MDNYVRFFCFLILFAKVYQMMQERIKPQVKVPIRFRSEEVFVIFWESISPSASKLVYWSEAQRMAFGTLSPHRKLHLTEECVMFFCRIAAGLKEKE